MSYVVVAVALGGMMALASLAGGASALMALAAFWTAGMTTLTAGLVLATLCVMRGEQRVFRVYDARA